MSGTRFARTGRCRFIVCIGILVLMVGMVAIFHSSQIQLDETREQRLHCEQQQEALNERLTSLVEQKFHLEKNQEREHGEYLETKRNLEQKIKELEEKHEKEQVETQMRYDKLQQAHKLLQNDHKHLKDENLKSNKQQLENINGLENKLQSLRSELKKEKTNKSGEMYLYKEKYNTAEQEVTHLKTKVLQLENQIKDYQSRCGPRDISGKPVAPKPDTLGNTLTSTSEKSFNHQDPVSEGVYQIAVNMSNRKDKTHTLVYSKNGDGNGVAVVGAESLTNINGLDDKDTNSLFKPLITKHQNGSLILNSVENFQIVPPKSVNPSDQQLAAAGDNYRQQVAPLSSPNKKSSTAITKSEQQAPAAAAFNATSASVRNARGNAGGAVGSSSSTSNTPPLSMPVNQKKQLPENVAPIPEDFESILQKSNNEPIKNAEAEVAAPQTQDKGAKAAALKAANNNNNNFDDMNDDSNLQHEEDIFDRDNDEGKEVHKQKGLDDTGNNDDDDGGLLGGDNENDDELAGPAAGDIGDKHNQQLLNANLKNEIADDLGKELDDVRLEEGNMDDDEDDDDSVPSARRKGDKAERH